MTENRKRDDRLVRIGRWIALSFVSLALLSVVVGSIALRAWWNRYEGQVSQLFWKAREESAHEIDLTLSLASFFPTGMPAADAGRLLKRNGFECVSGKGWKPNDPTYLVCTRVIGSVVCSDHWVFEFVTDQDLIVSTRATARQVCL